MEVVMGDTGDKEESDPKLSLRRRRRLTGVIGSWACEVDATTGGGLSPILRFFPLFWLGVGSAMTMASEPITTRHTKCTLLTGVLVILQGGLA